MLTAIVLAVLCAAYDRISGWGANGLKRIALTAVLALGIWSISMDPRAAGLLAVGVYVWRSRPFGRLLAAFHEDFARAVLRHLWALACVPGVLALSDYWPRVWGGFDPPIWAKALGTIPLTAWAIASAPFVVFAVWAALLSRWNRMEARKGRDINARVEVVRGASLGLAIGLALIAL